jgi:hypothetical protein
MFENAAGLDFRAKSTSMGTIDKGTTSGTYARNTNAAGAARPTDRAADIGAYAYGLAVSAA